MGVDFSGVGNINEGKGNVSDVIFLFNDGY